MVRFILEKQEKEEIATSILNQLPEWFGIPESTAEYVKYSREYPMWAYFDEDKPVGFIALKETGASTAEIYVMGTLKEYHRRGIGRALWNAFEEYAKQKGYQFAQVKTVKKGCYKTYDISNAYYESLGFKEFECIPELWDPHNPCQIYVKYIG